MGRAAPIEATKETMGTLKNATNPPSREQLLAAVALENPALTQQRQNPLKGYKPTKDRPVGEQVLDELRGVQAIVAARLIPASCSVRTMAGGCYAERRR